MPVQPVGPLSKPKLRSKFPPGIGVGVSVGIGVGPLGVGVGEAGALVGVGVAGGEVGKAVGVTSAIGQSPPDGATVLSPTTPLEQATQ